MKFKKKMKLLEFTINIKAKPEKVWNILFTMDSEGKWAGAMDEGSYFEGTWEKGSIIKFIDPQNNGMYNLVQENIPCKEVRMKHLGWILQGELSPQPWEDSTITYLLESRNKGTVLTAKVNSMDEFVDFFNSNYPKNFEKIKKFAEDDL